MPAAVAVNVYVPLALTVMVAPVICAGCPYVVPVGTTSLVLRLPGFGTLMYAVAASSTKVFTGTVITNVCVGQSVV